MAKPDQTNPKKEKNKQLKWVLSIFIATIFISAISTWASEEVMDSSSMGVAFVILMLIVLVGILFDVVGVAVTSADEKPFHSMAARKVSGAHESIQLLRNAERVSSVCNDVGGDICGVVSGSASATIAAQILANFDFSAPKVVSLIMSALVAALTVGGKAIGKSVAIRSCTYIVYTAGKVIYFFKHPFGGNRRGRKK